MRTLIVSHTAALGGAEHSLLRFLDALPAGYATAVACPDGPLAGALAARGVPRLALRGTTGSLRLHPVHTPQAVAEIAEMAMQVRRHAGRLGVQMIHANSVRAGLVAVGARALGGPPVAVHVRDVLPPGRVSDGTRAQLRRGARTIVAISQHVARAFAGDPRGPGVHVVMELVDPRRFAPAPQDRARAALGLPARRAGARRARADHAVEAPGPRDPRARRHPPHAPGRDPARRRRGHVRRARDAHGQPRLRARPARARGAARRRRRRPLPRPQRRRAVRPGRDRRPARPVARGAVRPVRHRGDGDGARRRRDERRRPGRGHRGRRRRAARRPARRSAAGAAAAAALLDDAPGRAAMGAAARRRVLESFTPARYAAAMARAYDATAGVGPATAARVAA